MSDLVGDLRFALRSFRRSPLHALATVLILCVGIGAVTLMFSVLNASVLRPLPFPHPERLVWLWKASDKIRQNSVSYDDFEDYWASPPRWDADSAGTKRWTEGPTSPS